MQGSKSSDPGSRRIGSICVLLVSGVVLFGCGSAPSLPSTPSEQSDSTNTGSTSEAPDSNPGASTNTPDNDESNKSSADAQESPGEKDKSQKPDSTLPDKLDGLNLDLKALFNYQLQDLPLYINQDNTPEDNHITDAGATLGRVLFYDPRLSTNNKVSCASCHQQAFAFGDPRALSEGVAGKTLRHSMRLVNIRFSEDPSARWDRKAESVEAQMLMPVQDHVEMGYSGKDGNPTLDDLVKKLQGIKAYQVLFRLAWGDKTVTKDRMAKSLAQFVRSIQSFDSKYDEGRAQVAHDRDPFPNFTDDENAGKTLFLRGFRYETRNLEVEVDGEQKTIEVSQRVSGGLNCSVCHRPPEFDIDPRSRNNGLTQAANPQGPDAVDYEAIRSASLRDLVNPNGKLNGGLFHIGRAQDLAGVTAHYNFQAPNKDNYLLDRRFTRGDRPVHLNITPKEAQQLSAFLRTLSGHKVYTDERWSSPFLPR